MACAILLKKWKKKLGNRYRRDVCTPLLRSFLNDVFFKSGYLRYSFRLLAQFLALSITMRLMKPEKEHAEQMLAYPDY